MEAGILFTIAAVLVHSGSCQWTTEKSYSYLSFTHHLYNATIHENSAPKTYVESPVKMGIQVTDLLWDIKYKLVAGDDDGLFRTEAYTVGDFCFLRISTRGGNSASLNREVRESYTLTIEATESTHEYQARTKVSVRVLDMNDLKPLFYPASYYVNLREDTPLRSSVARVSATDADISSNANFYYSFTDRAHPFAVDPFTGTVTLIKKLEHSRVQRYDLTILAEDRNKKISGTRKFGNTARVVISIDKVSPKPPRIKPQTTIAEVDKISVIIAVEDVEKGLESLSVVAGDPLRNFEIIPFNLEGHTFQVVSTKRINWLKSPFGMNLSIQAKDRSNPPLISHITDIHIPAKENTSLKFEKELYHATLSEFAPPKSNVVRVSVKPNGSNVTFQIKNNPDSSKFYINSKSGIVVTTQSMDFAKKSQFEFIVMANQGEAETRVVVDIIDENDNAPTFTHSSYQGTLPENIPIGSSVLTVTATDRDTGKNGMVTYAIANAGPVPFTVNPFSGLISTSEELDYELMQRWFHLRVWASDSGLPFSHVSECAVTLVMSNVNDNVPLFERVGCNATIPHDLGVGESVGAVSALDLDELEHIRYRIESDEYGLFEVDPVSGTIILAKRIPPFLLVSQMPTLNFSIMATDGKYNAIPTSVRVTLTKSGSTARMHCHETGVLEQLTERLIKSIKPETSVQEEDTFSEVHIINRHSPKFDTSLPSSIDIREDFKLNSTILHFKATDDDTGFNSMLVYVISSGNEDGCFTIEMDSGDLKIICRLDRESKAFYILNITVYDLGTPQKSVWKFLAVNILDANDNPPIFDQPRYVITIPENTEVDKSIFEVHATDIDLDDNGNIKYSLQSSSETFKINEQTGVVRVTGRLDRETCQRHDLKIEARDQAKKDPQLFTTTDLVVVLQDINDNPPKFVPKLYKIQIPEDVPLGTVLLWVESYDFDLGSGRDISYNLKNTENGMFFLDSFTGSLTLEKELDFEKKHLYNLTVRAVDHGLPRSLSSSCFVEVEVLDVNENLNPPVFSRFVYETKVREDAAVGTSVLTLTAEDQDYGRDGVVRFHILDGSGLGVFTVDAETGVIRTAVSLDRETMVHYWLTVSATDLGTIPLISWTEVYVEVLDINDNAPEPSQPAYFGSVLENLPGNTFVLQVKATDADSSSEGQLTFQIQETQRTYFTINPQTGAISTLVALDRELKAEHILEVTVSDNGSPALHSTATVVVQVLDVNDNSPKFSHMRFEVALPERRGVTEPQVVYRMVARDDDEGPNAEVTYRLVDSLDQKFDIHPTTGVVSSRSDFEHGDYNILSIKATDHGVPAKSSEARLYIQWLPSPKPTPETLAFDEPHFTFAVMETDPVTHMVGIISTEITPNPIWFDIVGGDGAQDFDIEKTSGSMMVARPLDAGKKSNYNLTVRVTDGSQVINTQAYIRVVDMNEHRPVFLNTRYEVAVPEDTARWTGILQIRARDEDSNSKLVYSIYSSAHPNSLNHFHLDPRSGALMVTEELDFETIPVHTLVVMVRDQEIPVKRNFVRVTVNVEDCNDHSPAFLSPNYEGSVLNLAVIGTEVLQVKALDQDKGSNAEIVYSIHSGNIEDAFSIDPQTGSLTVAKPLENLPQELYHLNVKATDQGFPQHSDICSVNIRVKLSENTQPKFSSAEYFTEIHESSPPGSPLLTVEAYSPSAIRYSIKEGDPNGTFHINHFSGVLSTQAALNFEECFSYRLQITATSTAGVSSDTLIYVYVVDDNDNPPVFLQDEFVGQISESAPVNSMVMGEGNVPLVVRATDEDTGSNSQLVFQILEPEVQKVFRVEPSMGTLSIISTVDFESTPEFHFSIQVWDSGLPSLYAAKPAKVIVRILDYNDCPPKFTAPLYESSILFPVVQGMEAIRVTASDLDSDVSYTIYEGNVHSTFRIDPSTGVISVNNVSSLKPNQQLFVKASDGLYKDIAIVKINVTNSTKTGLEFEQKFYAATVMENITFVETLAVLRASGSYLNEPLIYSVLNPQGMFSVVSTSGVLETTGVPFDREEKDEYDVVVEVRDMRSPPRIAVTHVKVYIGDSNDNTPEFLNSPYFVTISDDADPGDVLFQVTAIDKDLGENGSVMYLLEDDFGLFRIDPYLGDLSLQRPLDFESMNKYVLSILARDEGEPSLTSVAELQIQVRNRTNPIFQSPLYRLKVPENISPFTTILHVQARNPEGYRLIYNLVEENASRNFHMDFKTGVLSVTDLLDYETQTRHILTIRATDSVTGSFSEATVEIEIEDINDNAPVFPRMTYTAHISEGLPVGTSVFQISATDKDTGRNKELIFEIMGMEKNDTDFFEINPVSGLIVTRQTLDFEAFQQYQLKIIATDKGAPPMSSEAFVTINVTDINDNPPNFSQSQYQATLNNMATCGHIVIKIQASDPDSRDSDNLEYKIISGNEDRNFAINKSSGLISFSNVCKRSLDPFYNLTVAVSDGIFQNTAPVNIDMTNTNKHSPYFDHSIYEAELAENSEAGTRVIRLAAIDPDDGPYGTIDYTIINKLADDKFSINNEGQIITSQPLDRENPTQRVIAIKVMAKDGGGKVAFCTVKIILTDENDNPPQFQSSEYQVSIQSNVNKGSPIIQIMAYDADDGKNADVTYTVDEAEEVTEDVIEINPFTGIVSIKESLVGLENKIFNFKVKARDGGIPFFNSTIPVQVKVVPPEVPLPRFSEPLYTFSASEDLPMGSEIGTVKADAEMPVIYSLVEGNTVESNRERVFTIDKESGTLLVQKDIDHEKTKWYQIDVMAHCNHNGTDVASLVSVSIQVQDVNDNQPVFEANPYRAFLAENMPPGTTVIQVTANDPDTETSGKVTYRVEPEQDDVSEVFAIDSESGWITTLKEMDREATSLYRFHVVATDHGGKVKLSSSVLVEVTVTDENDNAPQFTEEVYQGSVMENSRPGEVVATVIITDTDVSGENRQIMCYITDGDPHGQFGIVQVGEHWKVGLKGPLDREVKDKYNLKITATDGQFQASASVEVHVLDINDNSPMCEQLLYTEVVMENSPSGMFILKVSATDPDAGSNGQVTFTLHGPNAEKFHLNPQTGELFTLAVLDREQDVEYDLVAKASDGGGRSCQADILLMIQDMNDNAPRFSNSHYAVTIFDNTTARTPIAVIYAKDPDTGINSEVVYSLLGSDSSYFSLDEFSGILRLERSLADETRSTFEVKVQATDRGLPRRMHSVATVTVNVLDLDSYQPVFSSSEYSAQIPESTAIGTEVLSVSALSKDNGVPIVYHIISGNEHGMFELDSETGSLFVNGSLDFEHCHEYYLSVEGTRGRSTFSDIAMVVVNVTDVNDNPPTFRQGDYSIEVPEDISPGDSVMQVIADDIDGPPNNLVHYSIVSGDAQRQFSIDPHSGEIRVSRRLDREEVTYYSLTVQAADRGDPPLSTAVQVTVTVSDINDNPPAFSQISHSLVLQEGDPLGVGVLQLIVSDRDLPQNGPPFSYHIVSGNEERRFHIDQGGLLSTTAALRKGAKAQYLLKIQVTDSGHPPLSSICVVRINVTEQSRHPPSAVPLDIFITTVDKPVWHRVIGKLHATDQDIHDALSYELVSELPAGGHFSIDRVDGKVVAERPLESGLYTLNVSVSDGRFSAWPRVQVHVWGADQKALDHGVTLQLAGMSPEEFVGDHWRGLQRSLGAGLGVPWQELHVASLQRDPGSLGLEVLLVWRRQGAAVALPLGRLDAVISEARDATGLEVLRVHHGPCVGRDCPARGCRNTVHLTEERVTQYATARASFITPQHTWESICSCNESAVHFDGSGYLKYLYQDQEKPTFRLSLRVKTSQKHTVLVTANSTDWGSLEVVEGQLLFRYSCRGSPQGTLAVPTGLVSSGSWHHVLLEADEELLRLALDGVHAASIALSKPCRLARPGGSLLFAAPHFLGCLDNVEFNGEAMTGAERPAGLAFGERRVFGIYQCCQQALGCASDPCQNGGTCEPDSNGEIHCTCPPQFSGPTCENSPCDNAPCDCSQPISERMCQNISDCPSCENLLKAPESLGLIEIVEISLAVVGLVILVSVFVGIRKCYVQRRKHKTADARDSSGFFQSNVAKGMTADGHKGLTIEMTTVGDRRRNDLDHDPFRSLKTRSELGSMEAARAQKPSGPVVCSVAPNLPPPPPSSSDNESIVKNNWELDYDVYPADPDYYGRPTVQEFPQFDIVEDTYRPAPAVDPRRISRFGGFPFPLDRSDRRAPLPPCYSNQNLDDFLGSDGLPLPSSQCPNEYTAISYYPSQHAQSLDNVSGGGYQRLSVRLSVAQPSYADCSEALPEADRPPPTPHSYEGSDTVESDYGSGEEVLF